MDITSKNDLAEELCRRWVRIPAEDEYFGNLHEA